MDTIQPYISLIDQIWWLLTQARTQVISQVNQTMVMTYRTIGQYIVEYEQGGADRAEYGGNLLNTLSRDLTQRFGKWFSHDNLNNMRKFYVAYQNYETVSRKSWLSRSHYIFLMRLETKEREFYELETKEHSRSLRTLKRQFDSALYERVTLSRDKKWEELKRLLQEE